MNTRRRLPARTRAEAAVGGPHPSWVESSEVHPLTAGRRTTLDWFAPAVHPSNGGADYVSLRVSGRNSVGNTIRQDVVRAYGVR